MDDFYSIYADRLFEQYNKVSAEQIHKDWLNFIPDTKALILDIGSGSGRDALWLAKKGHEVIAVEPADKLRAKAYKCNAHPAIQWLRDSLPAMKEIIKLDYKFDLILLSAIWNHVSLKDRERSFRKLANLLKPGGKLILTLRHGPSPDERVYHPASSEEVCQLARWFMLEVLLDKHSSDELGRNEVSWTTIVLQLPDDGTHALPLLRHVIINDTKSSTYKLALLRVILRIADGARGMILEKNDDHVTLPFGLVALYWARMFKPLVLDKSFRQQPHGRLGFVKEAFTKLKEVSPYDLRIGAKFKGDRARNLIKALRDIRNVIKKMPAFYITFPNTDDPVFVCNAQQIREKDNVNLNREFLSGFGAFKVPRNIWDSLSRYSCWIEPSILNEWCNLMKMYDSNAGVSVELSHYLQSLAWLEAERDTLEIRKIVENLRKDGRKIHCVWTGKPLSEFDIDHCFPFAYWPNNDLWNLLPALRKANSNKSNKLPTAAMLEKAQERIYNWWDLAYNTTPFKERFFIEANAALPIINQEMNYDNIYSGMQNQRIQLKVNQQIAEWDGLK